MQTPFSYLSCTILDANAVSADEIDLFASIKGTLPVTVLFEAMYYVPYCLLQ